VHVDIIAGRDITLSFFGAEFFPIDFMEAESDLTFLDFFQQQRDGRVVGVVALDLETLP
jgi:hypothetical protein